MSQSIPQPTIVAPPAEPQSKTLIPRNLTALAQLGWWLVFGAIVILNLLALPLNYQGLQRECVGGLCIDQQLGFLELRGWLELGLSRASYATVALGISLLPIVIYLGTALFLYRSKPDARIVYFTSLILILFGGVSFPGLLKALARDNTVWWFPVLTLDYLGSVGVVAFFYLFPNGQFLPRWTRVALLLWAIEQVLERLDAPPLDWNFLPLAFLDVAFLLAILSAIVAQVLRYRRHSTPTERQQTKWVVLGTTTALTGLLVSYLIFGLSPSLQQSVIAEVTLSFVLSVLICLIPISIAIAMLRARLWDIDLILNRALVYGTVTAVLTGLLAVSADLAKRFFVAVSGASDLAPIFATLIVVAAFEPIRKRAQLFADRHVKYATGTLGAFGDELNTFVRLNDADALAQRFLQEAIKTFGAGSGAVYLGNGTQMRLVSSVGAWNGNAALAVPMEYAGITAGLIALGVRTNGEHYDEAQRENLKQMAALVAHAIELTQHLKHGTVPVQS